MSELSGYGLAIELEDKPREECGVVAIYAPEKFGPRETLPENIAVALGNLQHRGQECAGIAASIDDTILVTGELGLVERAFRGGEYLKGLDGNFGLGHVRYATSYRLESSDPDKNKALRRMGIQPMHRSIDTPSGKTQIALGYNGHIQNIDELAAQLIAERGRLTEAEQVTDTAVMTSLIAQRIKDGDSVSDALTSVAKSINGAYSLTLWSKENGRDTIWALRDPHGFRPLVLGAIPGGGWMVASEVGALEIVDAEYTSEIAPGDMAVINRDGIQIENLFSPTPRQCIFEDIYLGRPDNIMNNLMNNLRIERFRIASGHELAKEHPLNVAGVVVGVPDSALSAAKGYARELNLPSEDGFVRNRYNPARSFIEGNTESRQDRIRLKISSVLRENVEDKVVVLVDDSLVRGNTLKILVSLLRIKGKAKEVHVRIASPPIVEPCHYGVDMPNKDQLIAASQSVEEIRRTIGADSLAYLSVDGMYRAVGVVDERDRARGGIACGFCDACMTGNYPTDVPKEMLEF